MLEQRRREPSPEDTVALVESTMAASPAPPPPKILRFRKTERAVHWAIAIPFLICWTTALVLVLVYNPAPERPLRTVFSWAHRLSGVALALLPAIAILRSTGDVRIHFHNIRQAWAWTLEDVRWLSLLGLAAISSRVRLPEQGKFNAAEKLNFMVLMTTYPFYIVTGLTIWLTDGAFISWIFHFLMAAIGTPLVLGHIYMATVNPSSRIGLQGMVSGYVDRQWAKHHYRRWYREHHERDERTGRTPPSPPSQAPPPRVESAAIPVEPSVPAATRTGEEPDRATLD